MDGSQTFPASGRTVPGGTLPDAERFLGVPVHTLTMEQTLGHITAAMRGGGSVHQVSLNVAKLVKLRRDAELAADVLGADIVSADGMGIVLGARLLGVRVPERVAGCDIMHELAARCAAEGFRPYYLGARPEVLARAMAAVQALHPALRIAGFRDGYFSAAEEAAVVDAIRAARPDCLFVGMPTPRKERFLARNHARLGVPFVMGVGGSIDILAGHVQRAPAIWQQTGFEWLYRIVQEPRRMWRRYLTTNAVFAGLLMRGLAVRWLRLGDPNRAAAGGAR